MNSLINVRATLLLIVLFLVTISFQTIAQDAEKQKIINVIKTEVESFQKKDHTAWANTWVHSDKAILFGADALGFFFVKRFDSLDASRKKYFSTPVEPNVKPWVKSDFDVNIIGSVAIVSLTGTNGEVSGRQNVVLEKGKDKSWKILQMIGFIPGSFDATDANIEASINHQGYQLISLKKIDEAIQVFTVNTQLFPKAWNTWDSLGEAYMMKGEKDIALGFYKKSVALNPKNENGKKFIEELSKN